MEDDSLVILKASVIRAALECDDDVLLDLVHNILISDDM